MIIGQDTAAYGVDIYGKSLLTDVLEVLSRIEGLEWIRLMYLHPRHITDEIIDKIASYRKVIPYLDIPIQHCADDVLKRMNRRHDEEYLKKLLPGFVRQSPG